jgi:hypothetical protein
MLSGIIAYQVLQQENPQTIDKVKVVLKNHPWYTNQWQTRLQDVPVADHGLVLFMQAASWPDDICLRDKQYHWNARINVGTGLSLSVVSCSPHHASSAEGVYAAVIEAWSSGCDPR